MVFNQQVASDTPEVKEDKVEKLIMLVDEAVKAMQFMVEPNKVLQDPRFQDLPTLVQKAIVNLFRMVEDQNKDVNIQSRKGGRLRPSRPKPKPKPIIEPPKSSGFFDRIKASLSRVLENVSTHIITKELDKQSESSEYPHTSTERSSDT